MNDNIQLLRNDAPLYPANCLKYIVGLNYCQNNKVIVQNKLHVIVIVGV